MAHYDLCMIIRMGSSEFQMLLSSDSVQNLYLSHCLGKSFGDLSEEYCIQCLLHFLLRKLCCPDELKYIGNG